MHTNSIRILDRRFSNRAPWLEREDILLSVLFLDTICVLNPTSGKVVWAIQGDSGGPSFKGQHDPRPLANGNLLLFDNWGRFGQSKVIEFDPVTLETAWQYPGDREREFHSPTCGTSQRLPNGNTLVTESDPGRAFQVTPAGDVVWEFVCPHRADENQELRYLV